MVKYYCSKYDKILDKHEIDDLYSKGKIDSNDIFYTTIKKELKKPDIEQFICEYVNDYLEFEFNQKDLDNLNKMFEAWWNLHAPYYYDNTQIKVKINEITDW